MNPSPSNPSITIRSTGQNAVTRHSRRWLPYAGAVMLLSLIVAGLWPKPIPVETTHAMQGTLRATVNEEGKTRIKQRYVVSAPVAGQLRRIPFKAGAEMRANETVVAVIDPISPALLDARARSLAEARRDTASANLEKARAASAYALSELHRFKKLRADKAISDQEFDAGQWRLSAAAKDESAAQSALRQAEAELAEFTPGSVPDQRPPTEVKAPVNGRILRIFEPSARVVTTGAPLVEIGDPTDLEVVIEVLSRDGAAIAPGAKVSLEQWGGGDPINAQVRLVEPAAFTKVSALGVEEQRVNIIADLIMPPAQHAGLGDSFRVEARITVWESDRTLKVPSGALFRRGNKWAAFVVQNGRAELRQVQAGRSSGPETQVLDGLKEGDELILYPGDRVQEAQRVKPVVF